MGQYVSNIDEFTDTAQTFKIHQVSRSFSRQSQWRFLRLCLLIADFLLLGLAFQMAYWARFRAPINVFVENAISDIGYYQGWVSWLIPVWLVLFATLGLYQKKNLLGGIQEYSNAFRATTFGTLGVIVITFLFPTLQIARGWVLLAWPSTTLFVMIGRFTLRRVVYFSRRFGYFVTPAVIVGGNQEGRWLAEQLLKWSSSGLLLLGFVDDKVPPGTYLFRNLHSLGTVDQLDEIIQRYNVGELILATSAISSRNKQLEIFKKYGLSSDINVRMSSGLYEIITTGLTISEFAYVPFVTINKARLTGTDELLKLAMDYFVTFFGLIAISPLLLVIALAVKLDSRGPIIHRRRVMGINGKTFDAFKFRSMHVNGNEILDAHPELKLELTRNHKLKKDPRVTRVGTILRKLSLDELPQLINVLRREMSLVGPRMITPEEMIKYNQWDMNLLTVRPGITGLWQISGRSDVSYDERVQMDMYYVRNWTIWLDIQILVQTIPVVIKSRGAY